VSRLASEYVTKSWYQGALWLYLFFPFMCLYFLVIFVRRYLYQAKIFSSYRSELPVIIVGNITVGGTGKSPLVAYLVNELVKQGYNPGIVSRGYGSSIQQNEVREVLTTSLAAEVGDEPLMLKRQLNCAVYVSPNRSLAVKALADSQCDIVIADDGLQHYALQRDIEICVVDGERAWGNAHLLPMGPLRESLSRLSSTDFVIINGESEGLSDLGVPSYVMNLVPDNLIKLEDNTSSLVSSFKADKVHAVAAIGNPERFFEALESQGVEIIRHVFDDHHSYKQSDFDFDEPLSIIMTEKDAVKCRQLRVDGMWYLPVTAEISGELAVQVVESLKSKGWLNG